MNLLGSAKVSGSSNGAVVACVDPVTLAALRTFRRRHPTADTAAIVRVGDVVIICHGDSVDGIYRVSGEDLEKIQEAA